jgi:hypothetical protein
MSNDEAIAIGWDAIDAALAQIYAGREPKHYGAVIPFVLGGRDPLQGISVYKNTTPLPHFHYVTYGFSELYEKEGHDPDVSGFGFELTFRLARDAADEDPPVWALNFLQNIARYVFSTGNALAKHHHVDLNGPIALGRETQICNIALEVDPQLGEINSQNGCVTFLQVVGLCADEYELVKDWDCGRFLEELARQWPLLITDLSRQSILSDPAIGDDIRARAAREGSSQGELYASKTEWQIERNSLRITLSATVAADVRRLLVSRVLHSQPFAVHGREQSVVFKFAVDSDWKSDDGVALVSLSIETAHQLCDALRPARGIYCVAGLTSVRIEVVPSEIKDQNGNVIKVIG